jgi:hypothetical protein
MRDDELGFYLDLSSSIEHLDLAFNTTSEDYKHLKFFTALTYDTLNA